MELKNVKMIRFCILFFILFSKSVYSQEIESEVKNTIFNFLFYKGEITMQESKKSIDQKIVPFYINKVVVDSTGNIECFEFNTFSSVGNNYILLKKNNEDLILGVGELKNEIYNVIDFIKFLKEDKMIDVLMKLMPVVENCYKNNDYRRNDPTKKVIFEFF